MSRSDPTSAFLSLALALFIAGQAIAQDLTANTADNVGEIVFSRMMSDDFALDVAQGGGLLIVDWRPRRVGVTGNDSFTAFVDVEGLTLTPEIALSFAPGETEHVRAVLIDAGTGITDLEISAFLQHSERLAEFASETTPTVFATFADEVFGVGGPDTDPTTVLDGLYASLEPIMAESDPLGAYLVAARELAGMASDRRSIFILSDANCTVPENSEMSDIDAMHQAFGVPVYFALYAEDAVDEACLELIAVMAEVTGGEVYTIDRTGNGGMQPAFGHSVSSMGGRLVYTYDDLVVADGTEAVLTLEASYLDSLIEVDIPLELERAPVWRTLVAWLTDNAHILAFGGLAFLVLSLGGLIATHPPPRRRARAWLSDIGSTSAPIPLGAGRTEINLPDARFAINIPVGPGVPQITGGRDLVLNGAPVDAAEMHDDDIIETAAGRRFRFRSFGKEAG